MERITVPGFNFTSDYVASNLQSLPIAQALAKLQAYEDSGLTPERVQELGKAAAEGRVTIITKAQRAADLAQIAEMKRHEFIKFARVCRHGHNAFDIDNQMMRACEHKDNTPPGHSWGECCEKDCPLLKRNGEG